MSKSLKYLLISFAVLCTTMFVLYFLVDGDTSEKSFYCSCGVVSFTQYLLLSSGVIALLCSGLAAWYSVLNDKIVIAVLRIGFLVFPCMLISVLLFYISLVFFTWV